MMHVNSLRQEFKNKIFLGNVKVVQCISQLESARKLIACAKIRILRSGNTVKVQGSI